MTKSTITRERIQRIIRAINSEAYDEEEIREWLSSDEIMELSRMALAAMDSSESVELPLDYLQGHKDGLEWAAKLAEANHPETGDWLYDDPIELAKAIRKGPDMPPAQVVPDAALAIRACLSEFPESARDIVEECADIAENACRAAMLHAGNSPAQSDCCPAQNHVSPEQNGDTPAQSQGWIPVSERMPEDEQEVITINKMGHRFVSFFDKHSGLFFDRLDAPAACCIEHVLVTHWMPLPAAPQEVR
ncbi:TPA: DUF551 domain-containing protein [Klebsiella pneumoniae]|nr:DUF551 domain-containing protein [Klebsiella pneumoniae]